jgi:hypothetical protein
MPENDSSNSTTANESLAGTTSTTPAPTEAPKLGRPASPWRKDQLAELGKAERLCLAAMQSQYADIFTKNLFPPERLSEFHNQITAARNQTATAGQTITAAEGVTLTEAQAEQLLITDIRKVQAKAKQKHARTNPVALKDYLVGTDVAGSRPALEQHSQTILNKLATERPPGVDTQFIQKMDEHRKAYVGVNVTQGSTDAQAEAERLKRDQQIEAIKDTRIEIQYVIDGEFPPGDPASAAVRREFDLPANRPFNAVRRNAA